MKIGFSANERNIAEKGRNLLLGWDRQGDGKLPWSEAVAQRIVDLFVSAVMP